MAGAENCQPDCRGAVDHAGSDLLIDVEPAAQPRLALPRPLGKAA